MLRISRQASALRHRHSLAIAVVTVVNAPPGGGTSQGIPFTVNADPSSPPSLAAPPSGYSVQTTQVTLQWSPPLSDSVASYQAQIAGDTTFATRIIDTTVTANSIQIGPLSTYSTYFWRVRAKRINGPTSSYTSPWTFNTYPAQISLSNTVSFPVHQSPGQYSQNDYRMLGIPGADNSLISKYLTGSAGMDWIAYFDNGEDSSYLVKYAAGDTTFTFARGRAFWVLCRGSWSVSGQVAGMMPDSTGYLRIALHKGWNIITNPFGNLDIAMVKSAGGEWRDRRQHLEFRRNDNGGPADVPSVPRVLFREQIQFEVPRGPRRA